jgi:SAM-dependent methyltransferase
VTDDPDRDGDDVHDVDVGACPDDLPRYLDLAGKLGGPVLEVGAGAGRVTLPLARAGVEVVAIDEAAPGLARLERRLAGEPASVRRRVRAIQASAARLPLRGRYPLILLPLYALNRLLTAEAQRRALSGLAALLAEDGRVVADVFVPYARLAHCPPTATLCRDTLHGDGRRVRAWVTYALDPGTQIERRRHVLQTVGGDGSVARREFDTERRWITPGEMLKVVADAGLVVERATTGYDDTPATAGSEQVLYTLRSAT